MRERPEQYQVRVKDLAEDSIEKCWIPLWSQVHGAPLTPEYASYFIRIYMMPDSGAEEIINELMSNQDFMTQIINKSMKLRFDFELDSKLTLWLILTCKSPGNAVMISAYLKWKMNELGRNSFDLDAYTRLFPMGFPTEDELTWLWECQKLAAKTDEEFKEMPGTGNLLDCPLAYKSFF